MNILTFNCQLFCAFIAASKKVEKFQKVFLLLIGYSKGYKIRLIECHFIPFQLYTDLHVLPYLLDLKNNSSK